MSVILGIEILEESTHVSWVITWWYIDSRVASD